MDSCSLAVQAMAKSQKLLSKGGMLARFRPVESSSCLDVHPCLRTSAAERLGRGCAAAIWLGRWSMSPCVRA